MHNHHATSLVIGRTGLLLEGPPGSGKSTLALELIGLAQAQNMFAALIADDQTMAAAKGGRLVASCPPSIKGQAEVRGLGIVRLRQVDCCIVDRVVRLEPAPTIARMPEAQSTVIDGVELPVLSVPQRQTVLSIMMIKPYLDRRFCVSLL
jgi:serine kinase of HPr protein (carbohydrate metabolism regulator)